MKAGEPKRKLAAVAPETIKDPELLEIADRLGLRPMVMHCGILSV